MKINKQILLFILFIFQPLVGLSQLKVDAGDNTKVCMDAKAQIGGKPTAENGMPDYTYRWMPAAHLSCTDCANPVASPIETTTYFVTVTDQMGNAATDSVQVELSMRLEILTPTDTLCREAECFELSATVNGGFWDGRGVTGNLFCPLEAGIGPKMVTYTVQNHPTCTGTATLKLFVKRKPNLDISVSNDTICIGKEIVVNNNSPVKESYEWFINNNKLDNLFNTNNFNVEFTDLISRTGTYTIVQKLIDHPCSSSDTLTLKVKRQSNFGFDRHRTGPCGRSYYIENKSIDRSLTYNWDFGNDTSIAIYQPDTTYFSPAISGKDTSYLLSIYIEDPICDHTVITTDLYVGYRPIPTIDAQRVSTDTICNLMDTLAFSCNLNFEDVWLDSVQWKLGNYGHLNGSNQVSTQLNLSPVIFDKRNLNGATTDTVTLITYGRCGSDSSTYIVPLYYTGSSVEAAFQTNQLIYCIGDTTLFTNSSDNVPNYFWDFGNGSTSNEKTPLYIYNEAGNYTIQLTAAEACSSNTTSQEVSIIPYPNNASVNYFPAEPLTQQMVTLVANADEDENNTYSYQWNLGDLGESTEQMPVLNFDRPGDYAIELLISPQEAHCPVVLTTNITVGVNIVIYDFFPTAFSPNADGINDCYEVKLPYYIDLELLQIYDRWGTLIFETNANNTCWNGKYNNKALSIGVYVFQAVLRDLEDEVYQMRGNITLVR